jgi:intermembrane space import and assembly protein 40
LEARVQEALACPCVADLRDGPCGTSFVAAFSCFLRDQAGPPDPAGVAAPTCLPAFKALQACMVRHPEAFADFAQNKDASDALFDAGGESNGRAEE